MRTDVAMFFGESGEVVSKGDKDDDFSLTVAKRHGCFVLHRCFARAVMAILGCCCAHQRLDRCTTQRGLRKALALCS